VIQFTWLQFRTQAAVAAAFLAVAAVVLVVTGLHLAHLFTASGLTNSCLMARPGSRAACRVGPFLDKAASYLTVGRYLGYAVYTVPALLGAFWGAPLVAREFETGTSRLAWTQSVTRTRWLVVKLAVTGLASMATAGLVSLLVTWWASPLDAVYQNGFTPVIFGARGIVPIGYAAFAFALGITAGLLIRRTLPAMAVTLIAFAAVLIAMPLWIRPHLVAPVRATQAVTAASLNEVGGNGPNGPLQVAEQPRDIPGAWILSPSSTCYDAASCKIIIASGQPASSLPARACGNSSRPPAAGHSPGTGAASGSPPSLHAGSAGACGTYLAGLHLRQVLTYQPASRYWAFQIGETAIFTGLAVALATSCIWRARIRST
jgi:hypothetical protein